MKKLLICILVIGISFVFRCSDSCLPAGTVGFASAAGAFYPADKKELSKVIDGYLKEFRVIKREGDLLALIVPHAGYEYSGKIAAHAYRQLSGRSYDTVVVIGISHRVGFGGISVMPDGEYETPLGKVKVDKAFAENLMARSSRIRDIAEPWAQEHSVDVQVPFLQKTLGNFKIVPVMFGQQTFEDCSILADAIVQAAGNKRILIVASSDMTHYRTAEVTNKMDALAIDAITRGDVNALAARLATGECEMCGYGPVITAMLACDNLGATSYELLDYGDSGDVTGDKSSVVGYMSAAIYRRPVVLDEFEQRRLLEIARKTLESYLSGNGRPDFIVYEKNLTIKSGVFVTLKNNMELRGCIGYMRGIKPLYLAVSDMAIAAATEDIRFPSVTSQELPGINIEISVLSPMKEINDPREVIVGRHGLYIVNGGRSGVLLPQVAAENNWTREEFLNAVCMKAVLDPSALNDPATKLYVFTAQVFHED